MTHPRFHDTLYSKSSRKNGSSHRDNHHFQRIITLERTYHPATHPIHFAADSPDKIIAALRGRYFSFLGPCRGEAPPSCCARPFRCLKAPLGLSLLRCACKRKPYLENFMSRPDVIPTFRQRRCTNRGRNFVRSKRRSTYTSSGTLYLFLRLNNSETTFGNAF